MLYDSEVQGKHGVLFFLAAELGKAAGSLHSVTAARDPELQDLHFPKFQAIPNNF